jgi:hypothetical protein
MSYTLGPQWHDAQLKDALSITSPCSGSILYISTIRRAELQKNDVRLSFGDRSLNTSGVQRYGSDWICNPPCYSLPGFSRFMSPHTIIMAEGTHSLPVCCIPMWTSVFHIFNNGIAHLQKQSASRTSNMHTEETLQGQGRSVWYKIHNNRQYLYPRRWLHPNLCFTWRPQWYPQT